MLLKDFICFPQYNNGKANLMTAALHSLRCLQEHLYQSPCEHAVMFLCQQESRFAARVLWWVLQPAVPRTNLKDTIPALCECRKLPLQVPHIV